jgi:hypothetical protein
MVNRRSNRCRHPAKHPLARPLGTRSQRDARIAQFRESLPVNAEESRRSTLFACGRVIFSPFRLSVISASGGAAGTAVCRCRRVPGDSCRISRAQGCFTDSTAGGSHTVHSPWAHLVSVERPSLCVECRPDLGPSPSPVWRPGSRASPGATIRVHPVLTPSPSRDALHQGGRSVTPRRWRRGPRLPAPRTRPLPERQRR